MRGLVLGSDADESLCAVKAKKIAFSAAERQVFVSFQVRDVRAADRIRVDWVNPEGQVSLAAPYDPLPRTAALCFVNQLPLAGFGPASQPGQWTVRVVVNEVVAASAQFQIESPMDPLAPRVTGLGQKDLEEGTELTVEGAGFTGESVVNLAQYTRTGGWRYLHHLLPEAPERNRLTVRYEKLEAAEYIVIVRNSDGRTSIPHRLLIHTGGYRLPFTPGRPWILTQGPYGSFSHWGNSLHAYDIAPGPDRAVTAMRAGVAHVKDLGLGQTVHSRSFGNYVTIDHGDGEYSHYAHLLSRSMRVRDGERVERGHVLAAAGTSGYSFGVHLHVHVTRAFPIASQSVPFRFEEWREAPPKGVQATLYSTNTPPPEDGVRRTHQGAANPRPAAGPEEDVMKAAVPVLGYWSEVVNVPGRARAIAVTLDWQDAAPLLDLEITSPSGASFTPEPSARAARVRIESPEAGPWRVSVFGRRGGPEPIPFQVRTLVTPEVKPKGGVTGR